MFQNEKVSSGGFNQELFFCGEFLDSISTKIGRVRHNTYIKYCVDGWKESDINDIQSFLHNKGYFTNVIISLKLAVTHRSIML